MLARSVSQKLFFDAVSTLVLEVPVDCAVDDRPPPPAVEVPPEMSPLTPMEAVVSRDTLT